MVKLVLFILCILVNIVNTNAVDVIEINKIDSYKFPVSISNLQTDESVKNITDQLNTIVKNNFEGAVDIKFKGFKNHLNAEGIIDLERYTYHGVSHNVDISAIPHPNTPETYIAQLKVYNIESSEIIANKKYSFKVENLRKTAHVLSDIAYYAITGKDGYFQSKIVFTSVVNSKDGINKINVIDQDGYNERTLISNGIFSSPIVDNKNLELMYTDLSSGEPQLKAINLLTSKSVNLYNSYSGLYGAYSSSPALCNTKQCLLWTKITPTGSSIVMSTKDSQKTLANGELNTSVSISKLDDKIVYEALQNKRRNLYIIYTNDVKKREILLAGNDGVYAEPSFSPDGNWIVFTKIRNRLFHIGIIRPNGLDEEIIYSSYFLENPSFMPNSDSIIFSEKSSKTSGNTLKIIDLKGNEVRTIKTSTPANSPHFWVVK